MPGNTGPEHGGVSDLLRDVPALTFGQGVTLIQGVPSQLVGFSGRDDADATTVTLTWQVEPAIIPVGVYAPVPSAYVSRAVARVVWGVAGAHFEALCDAWPGSTATITASWASVYVTLLHITTASAAACAVPGNRASGPGPTLTLQGGAFTSAVAVPSWAREVTCYWAGDPLARVVIMRDAAGVIVGVGPMAEKLPLPASVVSLEVDTSPPGIPTAFQAVFGLAL